MQVFSIRKKNPILHIIILLLYYFWRIYIKDLFQLKIKIIAERNGKIKINNQINFISKISSLT